MIDTRSTLGPYVLHARPCLCLCLGCGHPTNPPTSHVGWTIKVAWHVGDVTWVVCVLARVAVGNTRPALIAGYIPSYAAACLPATAFPTKTCWQATMPLACSHATGPHHRVLNTPGVCTLWPATFRPPSGSQAVLANHDRPVDHVMGASRPQAPSTARDPPFCMHNNLKLHWHRDPAPGCMPSLVGHYPGNTGCANRRPRCAMRTANLAVRHCPWWSAESHTITLPSPSRPRRKRCRPAATLAWPPGKIKMCPPAPKGPQAAPHPAPGPKSEC